ncbi:hypothetical protein M413DRAFT_20524 [Hebeloma cylindrosporum]|uniref:Uncharacterized protein n=1 Tax=Hebeloma cylindrosporum TaxID=76867 RepID=A0A0C3BY98_HEBCY|nr:hypothetical protein M413DRAFT_20524 [Hebeloma cylindrosporum h7]
MRRRNKLKIKIAREYIGALKNATLDSDLSRRWLGKETIKQIRNPPTSPLMIDNPTTRLSLDLYLAVGNASQETYNSTCAAIRRRFPDEKLLSYFLVKKLVEDLTGITLILEDMCINSCTGYTGPYSDHTHCPICGESRYEATLNRQGKQIARKQFQTVPIAPQLQALKRSKESALRTEYRQEYTDKILAELRTGPRKSPFRDFFDGSDYLNSVQSKKIKAGDMVLLLSMDGAQLYRNKASECWMYIWIILDHAPQFRYKKRHILPGGFIPGPNKPKNLDSFIFPGLYHLASVQNDGLPIWDASRDVTFISNPFLALATADGPGMACLNGCVGHQGKIHCRLQCPLKGRHKPGASQYYPARLKPQDYSVPGCDHGDVDLNTLLETFDSKEASSRYRENLLFVEQSPNAAEFKRRRLETGICKPSILLGIPEKHILGLPGCFPLDIMHLPALNIPDLFIPLWRGTFDCDKTDNRDTWTWAVLRSNAQWKAHGKAVGDATPYFPGSFDRPPRNPAEKISSGYKAWEFLLYFYGLGPCLFFQVLPDLYWKNYCKLVRGIRILMQEEIFPEELIEAQQMLTEFSDEFEEIYCQRRTDRLHFVRPSIHTPSHMPSETERVGPGIIYAQWGIERSIGNLGEEIKQHSNPFSNLAQRGLRRCQVNALKAMIPDIEPCDDSLPRGALDLGDQYYFLYAMDTAQREVTELEKEAFKLYLESASHLPPREFPVTKVTRWARLRLPNCQTARSFWKEGLKPIEKLRCSRNVKPVAVVSLYGDPHPGLLSMSSKTYYSVQHLRETGICVIPAKSIQAVVAMVPDHQYGKYIQDGTHIDRWQVVEKPGLKLDQRILEEGILDV